MVRYARKAIQRLGLSTSVLQHRPGDKSQKVELGQTGNGWGTLKE